MTLLVRSLGLIPSAGFAALLIGIAGCGGAGGTTQTHTTLAVTLGSTNVVVPQDGTAVQLPVNVTGWSGSVAVTVLGLPAGVTLQHPSFVSGPPETLTFAGSTSAAAGSYSPTVQVSSGGQTISKSFSLISAVTAKVGSSIDTTQGVNGVLKQFMSTSFQIGGWTTDYFGTGSTKTAREAMLTQLGPQHIRVQVVAGAIPMVANTGNAIDWDFTLLDTTLQPVLETADHSPELQVAVAPAWMCDSNGYLDIANHLNDFAAFSANMVRYYNKGGFDVNGKHFQSPSATPIQWWGIFNEFNGNGLSAADYVKLYNAVVPAMLAVDPTIKLSAFELSDWGLDTGGAGDPMVFLPPFLAPANSGGVNTQVDVLSTHFYSSCNQKDTDTELFDTIPQFVANVKYLYQELQTRPDLANVPVWVTENNVNADWSNNGMSECNPRQVFQTDTRGTSAYFAAWRPYVFSQLGKAGNQALYHWDYTADQQYSEVDSNGNPYLSYWVDKTLESLYPSTVASPGPDILELSSTDTLSVEVLATKDQSRAVTVMVVDRAVHASSDNNGSGDPRTVVLDLTSLGSFSSASLLSINAATSASNGPAAASVAPASRMTVTLPGYGVTFLILKP